jgi:hypothetical protein
VEDWTEGLGLGVSNLAVFERAKKWLRKSITANFHCQSFVLPTNERILTANS